MILRELGGTPPKINRGLALLEGLGLLKETTGKGRNRVFAYTKYIALLSEETAPL